MTLFACASVAVQHSLALGRRTLLPLVAVVAVAEPLLLRSIGRAADDLAVALVLVQLGLAARRRPARRPRRAAARGRARVSRASDRARSRARAVAPVPQRARGSGAVLQLARGRAGGRPRAPPRAAGGPHADRPRVRARLLHGRAAGARRDGDRDRQRRRRAPARGAASPTPRRCRSPTAAADGVVCSNLLEHTRDAEAVIREIERVLRPGGWAYLSWTNWYSPHGGHEMSPYHLLGPAPRPAAVRAPARAAAQEPLRRGAVPGPHRPDAALRRGAPGSAGDRRPSRATGRACDC